MKKFVIVWLLGYLFFSVQAQIPYASLREKNVFAQLSLYQKGEKKMWELLVSPASPLTDEQNALFEQKTANFVEKMRQKKQKQSNDSRFLQILHHQIHQEFLQTYRSPAHFTEIFESQTYDCLTGTLLTGYVLNQLGYVFEVIETPDHVFLQVILPEKKILIETTDAFRGVLNDEQVIEKKMTKYAEKKVISLFELSGLQYYNQAVQYYQNYRFAEAETALSKADLIYPSERNTMLKPLISKYLQKEVALVQAKKE